MIKINDDFEFEWDGMQWVLYQWRDGVNPKTKKPSRRARPTYYPTLHQLCCRVVELNAAAADSMLGMVSNMRSVEQSLLLAIQRAGLYPTSALRQKIALAKAEAG